MRAHQLRLHSGAYVMDRVMGMRANPVTALFMRVPSRWESFRLRLTWHYIRQTRLFLPLTDWWLNRG